jgi:hypothetical protein
MGDFKVDFRDGVLSAFDLFGSITINDYKEVVKRDPIKEAWAIVGKGLESTFQIEITQFSQSFSGPIPHPDILLKYKDVDTLLPSRLVAMTERNIKARKRA